MNFNAWLVGVCAGVLVGGCATKPANFDRPDDNVRAYFDVLRSDFNSAKTQALNEVMKLSAAEADTFWPIYRDYEKALAPVGDRKLALIREFLMYHKAGTLTDEQSKELSAQWLQNAQDRLDLWKRYHQQISTAVSPLRAAQFLQVENQMGLFVDIAVASEMPMIGSAPGRTP